MESDQHKAKVALVKRILRADGWTIRENSNARGEGGFQFPEMLTDRGPRQYTADIVADKNHVRIIAEIDSKEPGRGHATKHADADRAFRTHFFEFFFNMKTVEIDRDSLEGLEYHEAANLVLLQVTWTLAGKPVLSKWLKSLGSSTATTGGRIK